MRRREFVKFATGAAAVWPLAARAQQKPMPVIGYLSARAFGDSGDIVAAFQRGLAEVGFTDKQNVLIETRFAEGHFDRLADLAADLVRLRVNVLVATGGTVTVVKAKPLIPPEIPIVFAMGATQ
jgi:putative ABC transport system substrate-binding protein